MFLLIKYHSFSLLFLWWISQETLSAPAHTHIVLFETANSENNFGSAKQRPRKVTAEHQCVYLLQHNCQGGLILPHTVSAPFHLPRPSCAYWVFSQGRRCVRSFLKAVSPRRAEDHTKQTGRQHDRSQSVPGMRVHRMPSTLALRSVCTRVCVWQRGSARAQLSILVPSVF